MQLTKSGKAKAANLSLSDTVDGTFVWTHSEEECPQAHGAAIQRHNQDLLQLDNIPEGKPCVVGGQTEGAGSQPRVGHYVHVVWQCSTHIPNIAVLAHQGHRKEMATGKFSDVPTGANMTRLETSMSLMSLKMRSTMGLQEKIQ
jgi:hypothetical protein